MRDSFETSIVELQDSMMNFAYQLTSDIDKANDLSQETYLKVLDNKERFNEGTNLKAWVFTIMKNIFINNYRKQVRSSTIIDKTEDCYHLNLCKETVNETPENIISVQEITKFIDTFSEELRKEFTLFIQGYKYTEIAEMVHEPLGTVKSRIFHVRKRLQEMLKEYR